tara:strand:+ start:1235 stop:1588 length:354 start_codon:yes stop_codon:yes gene_type:complete
LSRRWFLTLSLVTAVLALAAGAVLWQAVEVSSVAGVSERLDGWRPAMTGARFVLIGLLAALWPRLPSLCRDDEAGDSGRARWMAWRWRVVAWLLVIELVIGQDLPGRLFTTPEGPHI